MYAMPFRLFALENILIPSLIMLGAALLLGVLIVIVANIFTMPRNEKKEALLDALPGANCGGCGFAGCEGYADYLLKPGADTSLCSVGGAECAREIAGILGTEAKEPEKRIVVLHCQGTSEHTAPRYEYLGTQSCHLAHNLLGGPGSCTYSCMGFGDCVAICAFDALISKTGSSTLTARSAPLAVSVSKPAPRNCLSFCPPARRSPCVAVTSGPALRPGKYATSVVSVVSVVLKSVRQRLFQ